MSPPRRHPGGWERQVTHIAEQVQRPDTLQWAGRDAGSNPAVRLSLIPRRGRFAFAWCDAQGAPIAYLGTSGAWRPSVYRPVR